MLMGALFAFTRTTQALTWLVLPIHQIYADSADFTVSATPQSVPAHHPSSFVAQKTGRAQVVARLNTAIRENLRFYAIVTVASVLGVVLLLIFGTVTLTSAHVSPHPRSFVPSRIHYIH